MADKFSVVESSEEQDSFFNIFAHLGTMVDIITDNEVKASANLRGTLATSALLGYVGCGIVTNMRDKAGSKPVTFLGIRWA